MDSSDSQDDDRFRDVVVVFAAVYKFDRGRSLGRTAIFFFRRVRGIAVEEEEELSWVRGGGLVATPVARSLDERRRELSLLLVAS